MCKEGPWRQAPSRGQAHRLLSLPTRACRGCSRSLQRVLQPNPRSSGCWRRGGSVRTQAEAGWAPIPSMAPPPVDPLWLYEPDCTATPGSARP